MFEASRLWAGGALGFPAFFGLWDFRIWVVRVPFRVFL